MRIAFISFEFPTSTGKGGIGTYTAQVASAMASQQCDVHVFAGSNKGCSSEESHGFLVHYIACKDPHEFKFNVVEAFAREHARIPFDLMESPEINGNAAEIKKRFPQLPLVVRLHAPNCLVEDLKKKYIPFLSKLRFVAGSLKKLKPNLGYWRAYRKDLDEDYLFTCKAEFISAPSQAMKNWAVLKWQIPPSAITIIPNIFIPPREFLEIPIVELPKYRRITFFGRLNALKGLVNATLAMKHILKQQPLWVFRVIGDDGPGPAPTTTMREWMQNELQGVIHQVEFLDGLSYQELAKAIEAAEIIVLPSLFESYSYACAEAMAAGKAIIGSKMTAMADLLDHEVTGILVDPAKPGEIQAAISRLINDDELRYNISIMARNKIMRGDPEALAHEYKNFYQMVLAS